MKIARRKPEQSNSISSTPEDEVDSSVVPTPYASCFLNCWRTVDTFGGKYRVLKSFWDVLLKEEAMPESVPQEMLKYRLAYEFIAMDHVLAKRPLPEKCKMNLEAARKYDVTGFHKDARGLAEIALKTEEGGSNDMTTTKTKKANKTDRVGVVHIYLEVFENQKTAQLTDVQIADLIEKKSGNRPTPKSVASYRCYYNQGTLAGQKTAPKDKVKAVRPVSDKPAKEKKPMSEATKAKLKAYTAEKKAKKGLKIKKAAK